MKNLSDFKIENADYEPYLRGDTYSAMMCTNLSIRWQNQQNGNEKGHLIYSLDDKNMEITVKLFNETYCKGVISTDKKSFILLQRIILKNAVTNQSYESFF